MNPSHHLGGRPTHATTSFAPTEKRFIIYGGVGRGLSGVHTRLSARGARRLHVQQLYVWGGQGRRVERAPPGPNAGPPEGSQAPSAAAKKALKN